MSAADPTMVLLMKLLILCIVLGTTTGTTDPCLESIKLHSIEGRSPWSSEKIPCDAFITQRWYKNPSYDMGTFDPGLDRCGSIFPIYLQGTLPNDTAIHDRTACMVSPTGGCADTFIVRVKKCGADRAYYLSPPSACPSTYCFHVRRNYTDDAPSWRASPLRVVTDFDFKAKYFFTCSFTPSNETLLYKITWFVNSARIKESTFLAKSDLKSGELKQDDLTNKNYKMNIMISCGIVAAKSKTGYPGKYTQSEEFFAGIRVLNSTLTIPEYGNGTILLKSTIPLPCPNYTDPECNYIIWMYSTYDSFQCQGRSIKNNDRCGVSMTGARRSNVEWLESKKWDSEIPLFIQHRSNSIYDSQKVYTLRLRVGKTLFNALLGDTVLHDVKVMVIAKEEKKWNEIVCHGVVDPHMRTFDGNYYEMHMEGEFVMYRHTDLDINVYVKALSCYNKVTCFCGIVIIAGRDVFMINVCEDSKEKIDKFLNCGDGLITVTNNGGSEYKVFLPTGTIIKVIIAGSKFINVYIYPSVLDKNKTEGLCGSFDGNCKNDFKFRNAKRILDISSCFSTPGTYVDDFSHSWKLKISYIPFLPFDPNHSHSPLPNQIQFCYCEYNEYELNGSTYNPSSSIRPEAVCDYRQYADCSDTNERQITCNNHRSKRSLQRINENQIETVQNQLVRKKKSVDMTYNEAEAYDRCLQVFKNSEIVQLCSDADLIDNSTLSLCVLDLMATGEDSWIYEQIESARVQCVHVVDFNKTLQREMENITSEIKSVSCERNCSDQGVCVNGTCICDDGFEEADCSINKAEPPEIFDSSYQLINGTTHNYLCDKFIEKCEEIQLYGQGFVYDPPPVLRIRRYKITIENKLELINQYILPCTWRGKFEVTCRLDTETILAHAFGTHYKYKITNDGINFGFEMALYVFHSLCQEIDNNIAGITLKLKDNYCFINGICYVDSEKDVNTHCQVCNSQNEKYKWSTATTEDCSIKSSGENSAIIIIVSVLGFVIVYACVVIICKLIKRKRKDKDSNTEFLNRPIPLNSL